MLNIVLLTILVLVLWLYWIRCHASETARKRMSVGLAIYMFIQPFTELIGGVLFAVWPPETESLIPIHLCDFSAYFLGLSLLFGKQWLFDFCFYAGISAGLQSIMFYLANPLTWTNPFFVENYVSHWLLIAGPIYILCISSLRPSHQGIYKTLGTILLLAIPAAVVNQFIGTNIMYLCHKPTAVSVLSRLPDWPGYLPFLLLIAWAESYVHLGAFLLIRKTATNRCA